MCVGRWAIISVNALNGWLEDFRKAVLDVVCATCSKSFHNLIRHPNSSTGIRSHHEADEAVLEGGVEEVAFLRWNQDGGGRWLDGSPPRQMARAHVLRSPLSLSLSLFFPSIITTVINVHET